MRSKAKTLAVACLISVVAAFSGARGQTRAPETPATETVATAIPGVIAGGTKIEVVVPSVPGHGDPGATLQGTEGPVAMPDGGIVLAETVLGRVGKVDDKDGKDTTFVDESVTNRPASLAWDAKGRLIAVTTAEGHTGVQVIYPRASAAVLADNIDGKAFGRPNDLFVDKKGGIYFTDPVNIPNPPLPPAVYYIPPGGGKTIKVADGIAFPNGVTMSPDEKVLYVSDTGGEYVLAYDVQKDGTLLNRRNFGKCEGLTTVAGKLTGGGDGFTVDTKGRVYVAAGGSVQVFSPKGEPLGIIRPSRRPQNLAFSGPDMKTLYIVGGGTVFKVRILAQGMKKRAGK